APADQQCRRLTAVHAKTRQRGRASWRAEQALAAGAEPVLVAAIAPPADELRDQVSARGTGSLRGRSPLDAMAAPGQVAQRAAAVALGHAQGTAPTDAAGTLRHPHLDSNGPAVEEKSTARLRAALRASWGECVASGAVAETVGPV